MELLKLEKKQKIIAGCSLLAACLFLFIIFVKPLFTQIHAMRKEWRGIEQELKTARNVIKMRRDSHERGRVLRREEISLAINEITKKGKAFDINFISISPKEIEKIQGSAYQRLPIHMNLESEYKNIGLFWGALEKLDEGIVSLKSFTIQRNEKILPLIKIKLILDMYVAGENG